MRESAFFKKRLYKYAKKKGLLHGKPINNNTQTKETTMTTQTTMNAEFSWYMLYVRDSRENNPFNPLIEVERMVDVLIENGKPAEGISCLQQYLNWVIDESCCLYEAKDRIAFKSAVKELLKETGLDKLVSTDSN